VLASPKLNDELKVPCADGATYQIDNDELEIGTDLNQTSTLQRPGDT